MQGQTTSSDNYNQRAVSADSADTAAAAAATVTDDDDDDDGDDAHVMFARQDVDDFINNTSSLPPPPSFCELIMILCCVATAGLRHNYSNCRWLRYIYCALPCVRRSTVKLLLVGLLYTSPVTTSNCCLQGQILLVGARCQH